MELADVQARMLEQYGIRVEEQMGRYVMRRLTESPAAPRALAVIGGNARTGAPMRVMIDPALLRAFSPPPA